MAEAHLVTLLVEDGDMNRLIPCCRTAQDCDAHVCSVNVGDDVQPFYVRSRNLQPSYIKLLQGNSS